ncbi:hypothetical protein ACQKPE_21985 [Pseudomonas sp. NPDC089554]|uniref:hypothetical protein n=1 Tax=Pseudomonas sp. NPDC089554 TaxID=3390653 RepID=UPI003CFDAE19
MFCAISYNSNWAPPFGTIVIFGAANNKGDIDGELGRGQAEYNADKYLTLITSKFSTPKFQVTIFYPVPAH